MDGILLIGRALFALLFLMSGLNHLTSSRSMAGFAASRGVPYAHAATVVSGVYILVAALMVIFGVWLDLGALALAAFTLVTAVSVHHFWTDEGDQRQQTMISHLKDLSLTGAGLSLFALVAGFGDGIGLMVTGPLFDL